MKHLCFAWLLAALCVVMSCGDETAPAGCPQADGSCSCEADQGDDVTDVEEDPPEDLSGDPIEDPEPDDPTDDVTHDQMPIDGLDDPEPDPTDIRHDHVPIEDPDVVEDPEPDAIEDPEHEPTDIREDRIPIEDPDVVEDPEPDAIEDLEPEVEPDAVEDLTPDPEPDPDVSDEEVVECIGYDECGDDVDNDCDGITDEYIDWIWGGNSECFEPCDDEDVRGCVYTGLEWFSYTSGMNDWDEADVFCTELTHGGGGWRLPTREELEDLSYVELDPDLVDIAAHADRNAFLLDVFGTYWNREYWTSEAHTEPDHFLYHSFFTALTDAEVRTANKYTYCVRLLL